MSHALSDIRILDFTRAAAGPSCTRMLAEMGAEVIKIEGAPSGDFVRGMSACTWRNDRSLYFVQQNRGKKSVCVNLKNPRGLALVAEFVPHVDAVVENFRPGVMEGLGFSYERLKEMKEDIILCSITGFGQKGPLSTKPGYDFIAQAYAGITSMIGEPDEPPYLPMTSMGDISTGVHGALAVVSAIHHRDRTGAGDHLDVALLDAYYHYHDANVHTYSASGGEKNPTRSGRHFDYLCPCGIFRANGGSVVIMAFLHHWPDLCRAMEREDLITDPRYVDDAARLSRRNEVVTLVENWLQSFADVEHAVERMDANDVPCAPVLSVGETIAHPHHRERGTIRRVDDPLHGPFEMPGMPIKWKHLPNNVPMNAPLLGEHNEEVLTSVLGRSADDVAALAEAGILQQRRC